MSLVPGRWDYSSPVYISHSARPLALLLGVSMLPCSLTLCWPMWLALSHGTQRNMRYTLSEQKLVEHGVLFACFLILFSTQLERNISYRTCSFSLGLRVLEGKENGIEPVLCRIAPPGPLFPGVLPIMMFWYKARVLLRMQFTFLISWCSSFKTGRVSRWT